MRLQIEEELIKEMEELLLPISVVSLGTMKQRAVVKKRRYSYAEFSALASDGEETDDQEVIQLASAFVPVGAHDKHPA